LRPVLVFYLTVGPGVQMGQRAIAVLIAVMGVAGLFGGVAPSALAAVSGGVTAASLHPGESTSGAASVSVTLPPELDVAWLVDTTGDMGGVLTVLQAGASSFWDQLFAAAPNAQVSLLAFDDFPYNDCGGFPTTCTFDYGRSPDLPFYTPSGGPVYPSKPGWQAAVNSLSAHNGDDPPEAQIPALDRALSGAALTWPAGSIAASSPPVGNFGGADFRDGAEHVVILLSHWPFHNAKRIGDTAAQNPYSFTTYTSTDAVNELASTHVRLVGIALNDDTEGFDFLTDPAGVTAHAGGGTVLPWISGANGVTERVVGETGTNVMTAASQGLSHLPWTVAATPNGCGPLGVAITPGSQTQTAATTAAFGETISVPAGTPAGKIQCSIDFSIDSQTIASQPVSISVLGPSSDSTLGGSNSSPPPSSASLTVTSPPLSSAPPATKRHLPTRVTICFRHHTLRVSRSQARRDRKRGARLGACKKPRKKGLR
jgi:hypothetical protein